MNKKFDFSEIDEALPAAEKMQEQEHIINALENNYEAVRILSANVEKLENRLSEALPKMDGAVSSLRGASTVTVGEEARKTLEQEGEKICRKMADRMERECARLAGRLSANDRVLISATAFWCMVEAIISLAAAFVCTCMANSQFIHSLMLWKILGYTAGFLVLCIVPTIFYMLKVIVMSYYIYRLFGIGTAGKSL